MDTAQRFADFARAAADGGSPVYAEWAAGMAASPDLLAIVDRAWPTQRQPVLVFAVARWLGAETGSFEGLRAWLTSHADGFVTELDRRFTQTNDVRRVGPVAVALTRLLRSSTDGSQGSQEPRPVALLEVGASAGLGLYPDRYDLAIGPARLGDSASGVAVSVAVDAPDDHSATPAALPPIAYRGGLDLAPVDVTRADDRLWLETLLWPGQDDRVALLRAACAVAAADPPTLLTGDAVDGLDALVGLAPPGTRPVVVTSGTLVYLPGARRQAFVDRVRELGVRWISYEKTGILTGVHATIPDPALASGWFATLALDGRAIALGDAHGTRLRVIDREPGESPS
ncbi:DUF2332 domain-containing protein [Frondihabitans australicus]|uniref:Uncharacterized protein DUF2332 n=1 Tax=Frondihabitans australicus TaxID=386892 RepID=A0A495IJ52_9MICO|nr:DUF2332 domain-containing protein [Frondihabitans australicus]RKR75321.1 uncharacterized protein DUF2332 [Frondihabitans australicus]